MIRREDKEQILSGPPRIVVYLVLVAGLLGACGTTEKETIAAGETQVISLKVAGMT